MSSVCVCAVGGPSAACRQGQNHMRMLLIVNFNQIPTQRYPAGHLSPGLQSTLLLEPTGLVNFPPHDVHVEALVADKKGEKVPLGHGVQSLNWS